MNEQPLWILLYELGQEAEMRVLEACLNVYGYRVITIGKTKHWGDYTTHYVMSVFVDEERSDTFAKKHDRKWPEDALRVIRKGRFCGRDCVDALQQS